jgi:hypothetical protein
MGKPGEILPLLKLHGKPYAYLLKSGRFKGAEENDFPRSVVALGEMER